MTEKYDPIRVHEIIIIINGKPQVGKDTFAEFIKNYKFDNNFKYYFANYSTVEHIKTIAKGYFNWNGVKDEKGRRLLSDLKDASTRYNQGPFNYIIRLIKNRNIQISSNKSTIFVTIVHSREPDEIQKFVDYFGNDICKTVLIVREFDGELSNHADKNVENYKYDYSIQNDDNLVKFELMSINVFKDILMKKNIKI